MGSLLRNLKVTSKLFVLVGVFVAGVALIGILSQVTLNAVKVTGPLYRSIVQGKDLVADVLPPPEYIIESYLVTLQMLDETDRALGLKRVLLTLLNFAGVEP